MEIINVLIGGLVSAVCTVALVVLIIAAIIGALITAACGLVTLYCSSAIAWLLLRNGTRSVQLESEEISECQQ